MEEESEEESEVKSSNSKLYRVLSGIAGILFCVFAVAGVLYACYLFTVNMPHESLKAISANEQIEYSINTGESNGSNAENPDSKDRSKESGIEDSNDEIDDLSFPAFLLSMVTGSGGFAGSDDDVYFVKAENFSQLKQMVNWYNDSISRSYILVGIQSGAVFLASIGLLFAGVSVLGSTYGSTRKKQDTSSRYNGEVDSDSKVSDDSNALKDDEPRADVSVTQSGGAESADISPQKETKRYQCSMNVNNAIDISVIDVEENREAGKCS